MFLSRVAVSVLVSVLVAGVMATELAETWAQYQTRMESKPKKKGKPPIKITPGKIKYLIVFDADISYELINI